MEMDRYVCIELVFIHSNLYSSLTFESFVISNIVFVIISYLADLGPISYFRCIIISVNEEICRVMKRRFIFGHTHVNYSN